MSPSREDILEVLRKLKPMLSQNYRVTRIGIFGSLARDTARPDSDVDVVIEMQEPDLFTLVHIKEEIEHHLRRPVDLIRYRETMNPMLKKRIDQEVIHV